MAIIISCGDKNQYLKLLQWGPLRSYVKSVKKLSSEHFHFFILINTPFTKSSNSESYLRIEGDKLKYQGRAKFRSLRKNVDDSITYVFIQASPGFLGMYESSWNLIREIKNDFEIILRTNVSTYWNPDLLLNLVQGKSSLSEDSIHAKIGNYTRESDSRILYPSGSGYIFSTRLIQRLQTHLYPVDLFLPDDVNLGIICQRIGIELFPIERADINSIATLFQALRKYDSILQFRVRSTFRQTRLRSDFIYMLILHLRYLVSRFCRLRRKFNN